MTGGAAGVGAAEDAAHRGRRQEPGAKRLVLGQGIRELEDRGASECAVAPGSPVRTPAGRLTLAMNRADAMPNWSLTGQTVAA